MQMALQPFLQPLSPPGGAKFSRRTVAEVKHDIGLLKNRNPGRKMLFSVMQIHWRLGPKPFLKLRNTFALFHRSNGSPPSQGL
jgi:hypothetical protein